MEIPMTFKTYALALILLAATALPAAAESTKWGALALDVAKAEKEPAYGVGGGDNEKEASDFALKFCQEAGGAKCAVATTYEQCGAIAVSGHGDAGWGKAPNKKAAEAQAIEGCKDGACKVVTSDCNN
jgi:hypothetical protein